MSPWRNQDDCRRGHCNWRPWSKGGQLGIQQTWSGQTEHGQVTRWGRGQSPSLLLPVALQMWQDPAPWLEEQSRRWVQRWYLWSWAVPMVAWDDLGKQHREPYTGPIRPSTPGAVSAWTWPYRVDCRRLPARAQVQEQGVFSGSSSSPTDYSEHTCIRVLSPTLPKLLSCQEVTGHLHITKPNGQDSALKLLISSFWHTPCPWDTFFSWFLDQYCPIEL